MLNEMPYHSLNLELNSRYGRKLYKLALDGGMTCPNRDGTLGNDGCIFCSRGGSGEFASPLQYNPPENGSANGSIDVSGQIEAARQLIKKKMPGHTCEGHDEAGKSSAGDGQYIAYFQSYTNTYASLEYLEELFTKTILHPDIAILSIATRPDCLPPEVIDLLERLNSIKPVWVELGLQTIHEQTARYIRRGFTLPVFEDAFSRLQKAGITVIAHVILGLPGESHAMMFKTIDYLGHLPPHGIDGIKLQLLHVLEGTDLAAEYKKGAFSVMSLEEYADLVIDCIALLPWDTVIHRLTGDGPKKLLTAPLWSGNKKLVLNTLTRRFRERGIRQGDHYLPQPGA